MATKSESQIIEEQAKHIFEGFLTKYACTNELNPDFGIDYRVQMLDCHRTSNQIFEVQLKGHKSFSKTIIDGIPCIGHSLETKRLSDYLGYHHAPTFLILVDVTCEIARYLFIQQYPDLGRLPYAWRSQDTVTIHVPDANDFADMERFRRDLSSAITYLREKHPGSVPSAIKHAEDEYAKIDPRFKVNWTINNNGVPSPHFTIKEGEKVDIRITAKDAPAASKLENAIDIGKPATFSQDEIQVSGSPLFDTKKFVGEITVMPGDTFDILLALEKYNEQGAVIARLDGFQGKLTKGKKRFRYEASVLDGLLELKAEGSTIPGDRSPSQFQQHFCLRKWSGCPILHLPFYESMKSFFSVDPSFPMRIIVTIPGKGNIVGKTTEYVNRHKMPLPSHLLGIIGKLRFIAKNMKKEPLFRSDLSEEQIEDIEDVYEIMESGTRRKSFEDGILTMMVTRECCEQLLQRDNVEDLSFTVTDRKIEFYSEKIDIARYICRINALLFENKNIISECLEKGKDESIEIKLIGTTGSIIEERLEIYLLPGAEIILH